MIKLIADRRKKRSFTITQKEYSHYWVLSAEKYKNKEIVCCKEKKDTETAYSQILYILNDWNGTDLIDDFLDDNREVKGEFLNIISIYNEAEIFNNQIISKNDSNSEGNIYVKLNANMEQLSRFSYL